MAVNTPCKEYQTMQDRWRTMLDVIDGKTSIKRNPYKYLPAPKSFDEERYAAYCERAVFYEVTKDTLQNYVSLAFSEDPTFNPDGMDFLKYNADGAGKSIYQLNQTALNGLLSQGRGGYLVDHPVVDGNISLAEAEAMGLRPTVVYYDALSIINWRVKKIGGEFHLSFVVLHEKTTEVDPTDEFQEKEVNTYRVLRLDDNNEYCVQLYTDRSGDIVAENTYYPTKKGVRWNKIPFIFLGSRTNDQTIDPIPLEPVANSNIAHYRNSAEYENSVFLCGQVQPVINELSEEWRDYLEKQGVIIGSSTVLMLPSGSDFKYVQAEPNMLAKEAMDAKFQYMQALGAKILDTTLVMKTATQADNEAMTQHSTLSLCVANLNEANEYVLKWCAEFYGSGFNAKFAIKQDFAKGKLSLDALKFYNELLIQGEISKETFHEIRTTGKVPEIDYEKEQERIELQKNL